MKPVNNSVSFNPSWKNKPLDAFHSNLGMICSGKRKQQNPSFISLFSAVFLSVFNLDLPSAHRRTPTHFLPPPPPPPPIFPSPYFTLLAHSYILHTALFLPWRYTRPDSPPAVTGSWHFLMDVEAATRVLPLPSSPGAPHLPHSSPSPRRPPQASCAEILYNRRSSACLFYFGLSASCFHSSPCFIFFLCRSWEVPRLISSTQTHPHERACTHTQSVGRKPRQHGRGRWHVTENGGRRLVYMHIYI